MSKEIIGGWYRGFKCVSCKEKLSWYQVMDSFGTCPFCGHSSESTVVSTTCYVYRKITIKNGWFFWNWKVKYEEKEVGNE